MYPVHSKNYFTVKEPILVSNYTDTIGLNLYSLRLSDKYRSNEAMHTLCILLSQVLEESKGIQVLSANSNITDVYMDTSFNLKLTEDISNADIASELLFAMHSVLNIKDDEVLGCTVEEVQSAKEIAKEVLNLGIAIEH